MRKEFQVHKLNDYGLRGADNLALEFEKLLNRVEALCGAEGREVAIVRTKLEEACFFAKKALASNPMNQENG